MDAQTYQKSFSNLETAGFCSQMSMILKAGISALEGISIMLEDAQSTDEKALLTAMNEEMQESGSFVSALEKVHVFPPYMLHMVTIGEETGTLDEVMEALAAHYSREDSIAKSIRNALTYPLVMICMMILVIIVLMTKVMPIFQQVFRQLGREMTGFSKGVLAIGNALSRYSTVFIAILVVLVLFLIYLFKSKNGKKTLIKLAYHIPFARNIYEKQAACRFASAMALTLKSGMIPERGLEFSENLIENNFFLNKINDCKEKMENGSSLSDALQECNIFTGTYARMASIAGRTGTLDEVMNQIAEQYGEEVDTQTTQFISALEPAIVIILSIIVGIILLSVMLPLLGIMSGL